MVTLFLLILAGFVLLIAGADFIVKSSVAMANKLKIPPLIVGLTVVAFGTSAPEFVVSLTSALEGAEGLVLGNVVGSNTANILLILGSSALIFPIYVNRRAFFRDYGFLLLVTLVFVCFALTGVFVFWMGIVMLLMLAAFIVLNYLSARNKAGGEYVSAWDHKSWPFVIVAAVLGLAAIVYGADLLVDGAVGIAKALGVSEEIIGLTGHCRRHFAARTCHFLRGRLAQAERPGRRQRAWFQHLEHRVYHGSRRGGYRRRSSCPVCPL